MFARSVSAMLAGFAMFVGTLPAGDKATPDLETSWYQQYKKDLEITIVLKRGKIVFAMKELKNRKLIVPVIMRFDEKQKLESIIWAKEAELRHDEKAGALLLHVSEANYHTLGEGSQGWIESRILSLALPPKK